MNKLLTTITLLCFSVAANADIYFLDEDGNQVAVGEDGEPIYANREDILQLYYSRPILSQRPYSLQI